MANPGLFIVVGEFTIDPPNREVIIRALLENRRQTLATEAGCRTYEVCTTKDSDASRIIMLEIYDDEAAFEAHKQTAHFSEWDRTVAHLIRNIEVMFLHRLLPQ